MTIVPAGETHSLSKTSQTQHPPHTRPHSQYQLHHLQAQKLEMLIRVIYCLVKTKSLQEAMESSAFPDKIDDMKNLYFYEKKL